MRKQDTKLVVGRPALPDTPQQSERKKGSRGEKKKPYLSGTWNREHLGLRAKKEEAETGTAGVNFGRDSRKKTGKTEGVGQELA